MRLAALTLMGALGLAASAVSANATPIAPALGGQQASNIVDVRWGCGRGFHPNRWGRCVPYRWSYNRGYRPYYRYYGGGYYPHWRYRNWYGY